jgi:hypothetical protein
MQQVSLLENYRYIKVRFSVHKGYKGLRFLVENLATYVHVKLVPP